MPCSGSLMRVDRAAVGEATDLTQAGADGGSAQGSGVEVGICGHTLNRSKESRANRMA